MKFVLEPNPKVNQWFKNDDTNKNCCYCLSYNTQKMSNFIVTSYLIDKLIANNTACLYYNM